MLEAVPALTVQASAKAGVLEAAVRSPFAAAWPLLLRRSEPDVGGFASVELTAAPWASSVGGVNTEGVAVLCVDEVAGSVSLRFVVQELLLRLREFSGAVDHVRRCSRYLNVQGTLLLASADHAPARLVISGEGVAVREVPNAGAPAGMARLRIDAASRSLNWLGADGSERIVTPSE